MGIIKDPFAQENIVSSTTPRAIDHFTDRETLRAVFHQLIEAPEGTSLPILNFYGVGGVGKTSLLEKFIDDLEETNPHRTIALPHATTDFADCALKNAVSRLTELRMEFVQVSGLAFPRFDVCLAVLLAKRGGPEEQYFHVDGWLQALCRVVEALGGVPISSALEAGTQLFSKLRERFPELEEHVRRIGGTENVLALRRCSLPQLEQELVRRFAADLLESTPPQPKRACRAVIFMDTYERLWASGEHPMSPRGPEADAWIRDLYGYLASKGNVLVITAGRDQIYWQSIDPAWCAHIDSHLVGGLSSEDTQRYLALCDIGPSPETSPPNSLQVAIIKCASAGKPEKGCLPLFVGLCSDIVKQHNKDYASDPPLKWFEGIPNDEMAQCLIRQFLTTLPDAASADRVQFLAAGRWFDERLLKDLMNSDEAPAEFRELSAFSFTEEAGPGQLRLHAVMRKALWHMKKKDAPDVIRCSHKWFVSHWLSRQCDDPRADIELTYHTVSLRGTSDIEWTQDLHLKILRLQECGLRDRARAHLAAALDGWQDATASDTQPPAFLIYLSGLLLKGPEHQIRRNELITTATKRVDGGDTTIGRSWLLYAMAETYEQEPKRLDTLRNALSFAEAKGDILCQAIVLKAMAWIHVDSNEYLNDISTIEKALRLLRKSGFAEGEAQCLCDLARAWFDGDGRKRLCDPVQSRDRANAAIEFSIQTGNKDALKRGYHTLGRALTALEEYEAADIALDQATITLREYDPTNFPSPFLRRKAIIRRKTNRFDDGIRLVKQALEYDIEAKNHEGVMLAYAELARLLEGTGSLKEAKAAAVQAHKLKETYGLKHPTEGPEDLTHLL